MTEIEPDRTQERRVIRINTAARRIQTWIGKIRGRRIPGGPYHISQAICAGAPLAIGFVAAKLFGLPLLMVEAGAATFGLALAAALIPLVRHDGVPLQGQLDRIIRLVFVRKPKLIGDPDEIARHLKLAKSKTAATHH